MGKLEEKAVGYVIILMCIDLSIEGEIRFLSTSMFLRICILVGLCLAKPFRFTTFPHELRQLGYPADRCVTPRRLKFLFAYRIGGEGGNDIPKEIVDKNVFGFYNVIISAIVLLGFGDKLGNTIVSIYFWTNAVIVVSVMAVLSFKAHYIAFLNRFKKLNRYNWKYFSKDVFYQPFSTKLGKCRILSVRRKGKWKYVTIQMMSTNEIYKDVLFCGKRYNEKTYMLYEKCHLQYVEQIPVKEVRKLSSNCKIVGGKTIRQRG